jgi:hypothetical protein
MNRPWRLGDGRTFNALIFNKNTAWLPCYHDFMTTLLAAVIALHNDRAGA